MLDRPASADALYIERGDPILPWRPILTGDVFRACPIPGLDDHELTLVISHPCTMRGAGGQLNERLQALPVRPQTDVPLEEWGTGHFRVLPLPELGVGESVAARLDEIGMVRSADLSYTNRLACLSENGICLGLQRLFHCFARVLIQLSTVDEAIAGPIQEAEMLEEWNERLAQDRIAGGEDQDEVLADEAREFDSYLSSDPDEAGATLRDRLAEATGAVTVRRIVGAEIDRRGGQEGGS